MAIRTISDVERVILSQHGELRAHMHGLATTAFRVDPDDRVDLEALLQRFTRAFRTHLDYEERELVPRVRELDAWGPVRAASLLAEHADQRGRLERASAFALQEGSIAGELEVEVLELIHDLLEDMNEEERWLEELVDLDENGHGDQMTG